MFSKRLFSRAGLVTSLSRKFGASILSLDKNELLFRNDLRAYPTLRRNYIMVIFWAVASLGLTIRFYMRGEFDRCNLMIVYWIGGIIMTTAFSLPYWFTDDLCMAINGTILLFRYLQRVYMPDFDPDKHKLNRFIDLVVRAYSIMCLGVTMMTALFCAYDPRAVIFLGELIPEEYFYLPVRLIVILFHVYLMIPIGTNLVLVGGLVLIYVFYVTVVLTKELRLGERRRYISSNELRKCNNIRHIYRSFQFLNANVMCFLGKFICASHGLFMIEAILGTYVLIRYWDVLNTLSKGPIVLGVPVMMIFWSFVLWMGGTLFLRGNKLLGSWKGRKWGEGKREDKIMKKFGRSCGPIVVSYGKQFVVKKVTLLNYLKGITRGIFRALLTLR